VEIPLLPGEPITFQIWPWVLTLLGVKSNALVDTKLWDLALKWFAVLRTTPELEFRGDLTCPHTQDVLINKVPYR
jgi:hypothetical protein